MGNPKHDYKILFEAALRPFIEMLLHRKQSMDKRDWFIYVHKILSGVLNSPEQYLGHDLPGREMINTIVVEIFDELTVGISPILEELDYRS